MSLFLNFLALALFYGENEGLQRFRNILMRLSFPVSESAFLPFGQNMSPELRLFKALKYMKLNVMNTWDLLVFVAKWLVKEIIILRKDLAKSVDKINVLLQQHEKPSFSPTEA